MPESDFPEHDFQNAFAASLYGDDHALSPWVMPAHAHRLRIYRNTVFKGLGEAVMAAFPTVGACLPPQDFAALALDFARSQPPSSPILASYGEGFADWLDAGPTGQAQPYLSGLARLDRLWTEAHLAPDQHTATPDMLASWTPNAYADWRPGLIASARLAAFDHSLPSLWSQLRSLDPNAPPDALTLAPSPEAILIWRPEAAVEWRVLTPSAYAFLRAIQARLSLPEAAATAAEHDPDADIAALFSDNLLSRVLRAPS